MTSFDCFNNKSILITGHTGFKGSWLTAWLLSLGANVTGISLPSQEGNSHFESLDASKSINDFRFDIRNFNLLKDKISEIRPDFIFHLAAQAIVKESYKDPLTTWSTNCIGTINLLDCARDLSNSCTIVMITSDKCYENNEWIWGYRENDRLGGSDPYSSSKAAAELAIRSYFRSYFSGSKDNSIRIASARAGNVIGGGDWSPHRIVPDCVKAWSTKKTVSIRNPNATRPWQHVLEPLSGYLLLASKLTEIENLNGESFNFGPNSDNNYSVVELVRKMSENWDQVKWDESPDLAESKYESTLLKLNCDKALDKLNWKSALSFSETVEMTTEWYKSYYEKKSTIKLFTYDQISKYAEIARKNNIKWAT